MLTIIILQGMTLVTVLIALFSFIYSASFTIADVSANKGDASEKSALIRKTDPTYDNGHIDNNIEAMLRRVLRDELAAIGAESKQAGNAPEKEIQQAAPKLDDDAVAAQQEAESISMAIVRQAISTGRWTKKDTIALLPHLGRMSAEQRTKLVELFYDSINRQEVYLEDLPPL